MIHLRFSEWATSVPAEIAVGYEGVTWTYAELERRSNQLAHHLRRLGVGREVLVGLALERSLEMVVAVLGVLKAGGAYVPLDPAYPEERLRFMVEDSRVAVILTQERVRATIPAEGVEVVPLDSRWPQIASEPGTPVFAAGEADAPSPDDLAYVMYTSGSTGRPKGVAVLHRGVGNLASEAIRRMAVGPGSRVLQLASLSFDASVLETVMALLSGSRLQLVPKQTLLSGDSLAEVLRRDRITTLAIPPSLLNTVPPGEYPELASIVVGGEVCPGSTANRWSQGRLFLNAYAPTEATIFVTTQACQGEISENPPLGEVIAGAELLLLDRRLQPVADGEEGEIYLGGVCLARGYHRRPGLTAERFVPHPFAGEPGARLYKTADLARWQRDRQGERELHFVGRADTQVKVRGLRIELGEIEAALRAHPGVRDVVVLARAEGAATPGDRRLVAYVVAAEGRPLPAAGELAAEVAARLPEFMVPTAWVALEAMPITPTGKADRAALPPPGAGRELLSSLYSRPSSATEQALVALWNELLGRAEIGIDDSLFELGGHSLVAAQIVARVRRDFGVELPLGQVFETPTVRALAAAVETLLGADGGAAMPPLAAVERPEAIPLTFPQEQVWLLNRLAPSSIAYAFQFTIRWRGAFSVAAYSRALAEIVRRHEVLRTEFPAEDGRPVQRILPPFRPRTPVVDVSGLCGREERALALFAQAVLKPFDAARLPLLTWTHVRLGGDDHWTLQVEHHFVHDGWSLAVFLRELETLYAAYAAGRPSPLAELGVQYADFALWQRRLLSGGWLDGQLAWWRNILAGEPAMLELPTDRPRPRQASNRGEILRADLPRELYGALRDFSRRQGVTLFVTTLTAFLTLLARLSGQRDLVIGSGVANRRTRESEALVGMVVNTVVLRTDLGGDPTVCEALARVKRVMLGAQDHQDLPFEKLVEELAPERDASRNPFFQVMFSFHDSPVPDLELPGLSGHLHERHNASAKMDLNVVVKPQREMRVGRREGGREAEGDMTMVWELATDLWDRASIERMWGQYRQLLAAMVAEPAARLSSLPLLTAAELGELSAWNDTAMELPHRGPVHHAFEAVAERYPERLAVAGLGSPLTYGQLDVAANRLAHRLGALGVGPEAVAAIFLGRSPRMVVAILATLKAGGAYLPLDVETPLERAVGMIRDSGARVVLTSAGLGAELAQALAAAGLEGLAILDAESEEDAGEGSPWPTSRPRVAVEPSNLAYVIYTSGSSGTPKGVMLAHSGLGNLIAWHQRAYQVTPCDRATQLAGTAFDASVWEIWPYLAAGASLHLPGEEVRGAPAKLLDWLAAERITLSFLPTPLAEALLEHGASRGWPSELVLRALLVGGDRLHPPTASRLPFALVNHYGPTEDTVVATATEIEVPATAIPSIGGPIANHQVFVLDRHGQPLPVAAPGELVIASAALARGYLGRPALTAERFVPHPFAALAAAEPGSRLYRTGDLVRRRRDGGLDFLGRIDSQVKIRGFRIELGEIEVQLALHPEVAQAAVSALAAEEAPEGPASSPREKHLVGYVVPRGESLDNAELAAWLGRKLPEYMVPAQWVSLPALPLTPNGKVDRRALPRPTVATVQAPHFVAPRTTAEELVAGIWSEVLQLEQVSVTENFFRLGGHSLIAARVVARLYDALGVEVPLSVVFEAPTVEQLALELENLLMADMGLLAEVGELAAPAN